jgi:hypothetical protein
MRARPRPTKPEPSRVSVAGSGTEGGGGEAAEKYWSLSTNVPVSTETIVTLVLPPVTSDPLSESVATIVAGGAVKAASAEAAVSAAERLSLPVMINEIEAPTASKPVLKEPLSLALKEKPLVPNDFVWFSTVVRVVVAAAEAMLVTVTLSAKLSLMVSTTLVRPVPVKVGND